MTENYTRATSIESVSYKEFELNSFEESPQSEPNYAYIPPEDLSVDVPSKAPLTVAAAVVTMLEELGISCAFGVAGGAMATLWGALSNSRLLQVLNFRHEGGAAFAAVEAYFATNRPTVVFTTAGPGITNALTGLFAARGEGAKVIFLSACTSAPQRGKWAIQETTAYTLPTEGIFTSGALFNYSTTVECAAQLPQIFKRIALGLSQPGGFVAHLSIPTAVQTSEFEQELPKLNLECDRFIPSKDTISKCVSLLTEGNWALWLGFGARNAAKEVLDLAEKTGAAVMCSPRAKGIFPEDHPQFIGVTGLGGHSSVMTYMQEQKPLRILVLGTRLGEPTSFWSQSMVPRGGFIHVDIDPQVPGVAYPHVETLAVQADIQVFVQELLAQMPVLEPTNIALPNPKIETIAPGTDNLVRPEVLMSAIQKVIVEGTEAVVMAESGNSFTWSTNLLRFNQTGRYRVSTGVGAMGHAVTGVVGAAIARDGLAVAIVGDGAMLMNNEISTAVKYQVPAIWIVLNDARYNMCFQGMKLLGLTGADALIPETDFVTIARGMGADGLRVTSEADLTAALEKAIAHNGPFVIDVLIDPSCPAPSKGRNQGLASQGVKATNSAKQVSFPLI